jgi:hypothetical protein
VGDGEFKCSEEEQAALSLERRLNRKTNSFR